MFLKKQATENRWKQAVQLPPRVCTGTSTVELELGCAEGYTNVLSSFKPKRPQRKTPNWVRERQNGISISAHELLLAESATHSVSYSPPPPEKLPCSMRRELPSEFQAPSCPGWECWKCRVVRFQAVLSSSSCCTLLNLLFPNGKTLPGSHGYLIGREPVLLYCLLDWSSFYCFLVLKILCP